MVVERRDPGEPWAKGYALCVDAVPLQRRGNACIVHSLGPRTIVAVHSHCEVSVSGLQRRVCVLCTRLSACTVR